MINLGNNKYFRYNLGTTDEKHWNRRMCGEKTLNYCIGKQQTQLTSRKKTLRMIYLYFYPHNNNNNEMMTGRDVNPITYTLEKSSVNVKQSNIK